MLTRDRILQTLRAQRAYLAEEFGLRRIGIFGSWAKDEAEAGSDLDVLAEFDRAPGLRFIELVEYLEELFGRSVDVLTPAGVEAIRNPQIARNIRESVVYA